MKKRLSIICFSLCLGASLGNSSFAHAISLTPTLAPTPMATMATETIATPDRSGPDCDKLYTIIECEYEPLAGSAEVGEGIEVVTLRTVWTAWPFDESEPELTRDGAQWLCYALAQADSYNRINSSYPGGARELISFLQSRADAGRISVAARNYLQLLLQGLAPVGDVSLTARLLGEHPDCKGQPKPPEIDPSYDWF